MRHGFSLIEVLLAVSIGLALVAMAYSWMTGSVRILSRGQNKMQDTNQAELVFRWVDQDVHCAAESPTIENNGGTLVVKRHFDPDGPDPTLTKPVTWTLHPGVDGIGSYIERAPAGAPPTRFAVGTLANGKVEDVSTPGRPAIRIRLTMKQPEDASLAVFSETFVPQNQIIDPRWNPVGKIPEAP